MSRVSKFILWFSLLGIGWTAGTGILLYNLPGLIMNKLSRIQVERAGAMDQWFHKRTTVDHRFKDVVRPNVDTVYSSVFADLSKGPYILEAPPINRYWSFGFYGQDTTNFRIISIRTHGMETPVSVLLVPEGYQGDTMGMSTVVSPSNLVWIIARLGVYGKSDEQRIHKIQDEMRFIPLSEYKQI